MRSVSCVSDVSIDPPNEIFSSLLFLLVFLFSFTLSLSPFLLGSFYFVKIVRVSILGEWLIHSTQLFLTTDFDAYDCHLVGMKKQQLQLLLYSLPLLMDEKIFQTRIRKKKRRKNFFPSSANYHK